MIDMNLYDRLPSGDVDMMHSYFRYTTDGNPIDRSRMSHFLRFWNQDKENLFHMFNDNFILRKTVKFDKPELALREEMDSLINLHPFAEDWFRFARDKEYDTLRDRYCGMMCYPSSLVRNVYDGNPFVIPAEWTINGKEIQVATGCKLVKMIGKIAKALGIDEHFEDFRQAHSRVLNQKSLVGTLCLSIHPMDYVTMSDNNCGWSSCMAWMEDPGDYRLGTIEMMNSPYVVVAYLEDEDGMDLYDCYRWNSKKWRQLYVVTPNVILGNRQYPYENDQLQGECLNWLRDMASVFPGYGPYMTEACNIQNRAVNIIDGEREIKFNFWMNYMYNDIYGNKLAYFSSTYNESHYDVCVSGPAVCTGCGEIIELDSVDACYVRCMDCDGLWRCDGCGDLCSGEKYYNGDEVYCYYCYNHYLSPCDECGMMEGEDNLVRVPIIIVPRNEEEKQYENKFAEFNHRFTVELCYDCATTLCAEGETSMDFGPREYGSDDPYTYYYKSFCLDNISDTGLNRLKDISSFTRGSLRFLRDAESTEERIEILKERFYIDFS